MCAEVGNLKHGSPAVIGCVCTEVGHLKQERRVMVHPLTMDEFTDVTMQTVLSRDSCEELNIHFVRPKDRPHDWSALVVTVLSVVDCVCRTAIIVCVIKC